MYGTKKIMKALSMDYEKIHVCPKNCLLFRHEYADDNYCRKCGSSRYIEVVDKHGQKRQLKIPVKVLRYLDFIKRLQRLFITEESAKMMKWHKEGKRYNPKKIVHTSEGEAWKSFDIKYPEETAEAGNVRIAITGDGFNSYGMSSNPYSCWPIFVIPLNLPPGAIMQRKTMFLSLIIPGPEYPGKNLSVFMQPLVDDLHHSWYFPRLTYDRHLQKNFLMKVWLQYCMHDFPGYALFCGWCTSGKMPCPVSMQALIFIWLKKGGKYVAFDQHRQFLPPDHPDREDKKNLCHARAGCSTSYVMPRNEWEDVMFYILHNIKEVEDEWISRFVEKEWTRMLPPTEAEALALLRKGADGRKNFVAWFMEKVIFHTSLYSTGCSAGVAACNWILHGKGRKPNGLLTVLLKQFWPGLFCPRPDRDPQLRVLATSWAHYEACSNAEYGTTAKAVITKFWQLYRVIDEHKARADVVLLAFAKKKARQFQYEVRWVAVSQYYHIYLQQKMTKTQAQRQKITMSREQFMMVVPRWCYGRHDGWACLVDRWVGDDPEFVAKSIKARANRGKDGTHGQGNRNHWGFKAMKEDKLQRPLSDMESWKLARERSDRKEGESQYYGNTEQYLESYTENYQKLHPDVPVLEVAQSQIDDTVVVAIQGKSHGRGPVARLLLRRPQSLRSGRVMVVAVAVLAEEDLAVAVLAEVDLVVVLAEVDLVEVVVLAEVDSVVVVVVLVEVDSVVLDVDDDSVYAAVVPCLSCFNFYDVSCLALLLCSWTFAGDDL
nr:transposon protein, putative, CACTA, En/Spm sub-class [Triticum aestivum]